MRAFRPGDNWKPHSADWLDCILDESLVITPLLIGWKLKSLNLVGQTGTSHVGVNGEAGQG